MSCLTVKRKPKPDAMQPPFLTLTLTLTLEKCRQSIELRNEYRSLGIDLPGNYKMMRMIGSKMQWRGSGR